MSDFSKPKSVHVYGVIYFHHATVTYYFMLFRACGTCGVAESAFHLVLSK